MAIQLRHDEKRGFLEVDLSGKLTDADYGELAPRVEELIREHGKLRVLVSLQRFEGWSLGGLWEDFKFDVKHFNDIERLAIVGSKPWHQGMAWFCKPFTTAKVRYFEVARHGEAQAWLAEGHEEGVKVTPTAVDAEYVRWRKEVAGFDFVPDEATADAAIKAVLGFVASRMEESEARDLADNLPAPLTLENLRSHQVAPTEVTTSECFAALAQQFGLEAAQSERLVERVVDLATEGLEPQLRTRLAKQLPADWGALLQVA